MPLASFQTPLLRAQDFTATQFSDGAAKADFGNRLLAFVAEDFPRKRFTQQFYRVLCQHFGMIAHYNQHGFWAEYFTGTADKLRFLEHIVSPGFPRRRGRTRPWLDRRGKHSPQ